MVDQAEVMQGLDRLSDQMHDLDRQRASWQGQFHSSTSTPTCAARPTSLSTALRKPQVRGRWGELHLRRAVELAGLVDRCDFAEQVRLDDGALRPDLVVHLVGGRQRGRRRQGAARRLPRRHVHRRRRRARGAASGAGTPASCAPTSTRSASKHYWRSLPETPEFVVLFVPAESFLAAALETDGVPDRVRRRPARSCSPPRPP